MEITVVKNKLPINEIKKLAENSYGTIIKVAVDVEKGILAAGGEWHSEEQSILVERERSNAIDVWGANFHLFESGGRRIEYGSLINLKPEIGHKSMEIGDSEIRNKVKTIIEKLLLKSDETIKP